MTRTIHEKINHCFENLAEAHATMKEAFVDASCLVHVLPKKGLALLLEAMATGSIVVQTQKLLMSSKRQKSTEESEMR